MFYTKAAGSFGGPRTETPSRKILVPNEVGGPWEDTYQQLPWIQLGGGHP